MSHTSHRISTTDDSESEGTVSEKNEILKNVCEILYAEHLHESPIDLNLSKSIPVKIGPLLSWINFELEPKKMKITNTGHSVILSGKWGQERPYVTHGVLTGKYVFSQIHFHWGINDMEGSEHTVDGRQFPGEIHVVFFKSCYLTQESALKEPDGVVIIAYILNLQESPNFELQNIIDALPAIAKAHISSKVPPTPLSELIRTFESDYFLYKGSVSTKNCIHPILWLITRYPVGISADQMDFFRFMLDNDDEIIKKNFRTVQEIGARHIFHILPSSVNYSTLILTSPHHHNQHHHHSEVLGDKVMQIYHQQQHQTEILFKREKSEKNLNNNKNQCEKKDLKKTLSILYSQLSKLYIDFI